MIRHLSLLFATISLLIVPSVLGQESNDGMIAISAAKARLGGVIEKANIDERPRHIVDVAAYRISRTEVSNAEFAKFITAGGYTKKDHWSTEGWAWRTKGAITGPAGWTELKASLGEAFPRHPVVGVSFWEAEAYAKFAGGRLPTEAEWVLAARGSKDDRVYPWGDDTTAGGTHVNETRPVGTNAKDRSPSGILDLGGNVSEWTSTWYDKYPGGKDHRHFGHKLRVVRGGSWRFSASHKRRISWRGYSLYGTPGDRAPFIGIRIVRPVVK